MIVPLSAPEGTETEASVGGGDGRNAARAEEEGVAAEAMTEEPRTEPPPLFDDGAPVGPNEGEEASFLAEQRIAGGVASAPSSRDEADKDEAEPITSLPPLEDLVNRIPAPTRALLDELFRAKFVTVKRVPKSALKH